MKIPKNLSQVELKMSKEGVTGRSGLGWIVGSMKHYGLDKMIKSRFPRGGNRAIKTCEKIYSACMTMIAGGERVEDIEILRADQGLIDMLGWDQMMGADTYREFMKDKQNAGRIRKSNEEFTIKMMKDSDEWEFTYDNDATYFDSAKQSANWSYQGRKQFSGLLGFVSELGVCNTVDYRRGNISPQTGILNQLRKAVRQAKKAGKKIFRFRSDSAGHQDKLFEYCNEHEIEYYISLDKNEAIKVCISGIKEREWKPLLGKYQDQIATECAESVYVTNKGNAMRILVLRWANPNPDLFDTSPLCYHVIGTNNNEIDAMEWLEVHNGRMNSENYNKEVKNGLGCEYTPSHDFQMNRCYFLIGILAYNILQAMKLFYFGEESRRWTVKTIRYRFIYVCGKIVKTGRKWICKIINVTNEVFELYRNVKSKLIIIG
ncbi:MAG: IS1380 family transposase [Candidatus Marinimicrobia bacterium]|nr:IS1380 family transposase [Candidatus Neomarinimicrobiota bacterium]